MIGNSTIFGSLLGVASPPGVPSEWSLAKIGKTFAARMLVILSIWGIAALVATVCFTLRREPTSRAFLLLFQCIGCVAMLHWDISMLKADKYILSFKKIITFPVPVLLFCLSFFIIAIPMSIDENGLIEWGTKDQNKDSFHGILIGIFVNMIAVICVHIKSFSESISEITTLSSDRSAARPEALEADGYFHGPKKPSGGPGITEPIEDSVAEIRSHIEADK